MVLVIDAMCFGCIDRRCATDKVVECLVERDSMPRDERDEKAPYRSRCTNYGKRANGSDRLRFKNGFRHVARCKTGRFPSSFAWL